jgi:hypothetical protein
MNDEDSGYWWQDLDAVNVADMLVNVTATLFPAGHKETPMLFGIVSGKDGGIIAYAIDSSHADEITQALNRPADLVMDKQEFHDALVKDGWNDDGAWGIADAAWRARFGPIADG